MDMNQLLGLLQIYPRQWPNYDVQNQRGWLDDPRTMTDLSWSNMGKDAPTTPPFRQLPMPLSGMEPALARQAPRMPTAEELRPAFDPQLRIGANEPAQRARASREGRAADLMRLLDGYDVMPGQEKWF